MCGRYSFKPTPKQKNEELTGSVPQFMNMNIAPTQKAPVLLHFAEWTLMAWGLVPFWSKDGKNQGKLINARSETVAEKPSFREAFKRRRCLVPADSFYEWRTGVDKKRIPYRILRRDEHLMFFAGIWERRRDPEGVEKHTFSILTTEANADVQSLHDRMPVVLMIKSEQEQWLESDDLDALQQLLKPLPEGTLRYYRVTDKLNKSGYDGEDAQEPVEGE